MTEKDRDGETKELLLVGGGHSHVYLLKHLGNPVYRKLLREHDIRVTLIAKDLQTPYSGMLPGFVAGHYTYDQIHLDLPKICEFSNIRIIHSPCCKIEYENHNKIGGGLVYCQDGKPPLRYDALLIDVGSAPGTTDPSIWNHPRIIPVKPIANFSKFYQKMQEQFQSQASMTNKTKVYRVCVVGGGAGGTELALSIQHNLEQIIRQNKTTTTSPTIELQMVLVSRGSNLLSEHNSKVQNIMARVLKERGFEVHLESTVVSAIPEDKDGLSGLRIEEREERISFHDCFWCTTAAGAKWLSEETPFACDERGFLKTDDTLQVLDHPGVFAAGDCAQSVHHPRPKAGVFAVRAGPPLLRNTVAFLTRQPLLPYIPQSTFLGLISTGDKFAIASKGKYFCVSGRWVWIWKDWIDRAWMDEYTDLKHASGWKLFPTSIASCG